MKDLISAAIKSTYETRTPGGVDRCIDVLSQLKSLSLSVKDILQFSKSIFKLETLRRHRHPKIREESKSLFDSWLKTLYTQGRDQSVNTGLAQFRLKPKKKENTVFSKLKRNRGSLTPDTEKIKIKKESKTNLLVSKKGQYLETLTREEALVKIKTKTDARKSVTTKQPCGTAVKEAGKISSVTTTALPQQSRQNIKDKDGNVTNKTLIRHAASSNPKSATAHAQQSIRNIKDKDGKVTTKTLIPPPRRLAPPSNPKSPASNSKAKIEEMVELFEAAKKAADVANVKGILSGKEDASRCVEAISLLMKINVTPEPKEPRRMMERLEGLAKHKDRKICNAASGLLQLWRQRIREQERKESSNNPGKTHRTCGEGFTRESTKTMKLVI